MRDRVDSYKMKIKFLKPAVVFFLFLTLPFIDFSAGLQKSLADTYRTGKVRFVPEITIDDRTLPEDVFYINFFDIERER